ncbi:hypothetical protein B7486_20980 [cyanobacterium TDX16]|nr:hypothetical protein B7486_20980 [cyanobacterium TDX16]
MNTLTIDALKISNLEFERIVKANPDWQFEQTAAGELVIVSPTGGSSGRRNSNLTRQLDTWSSSNNLGIAFDSSTLFILPNGAKRSPDASWVRSERWENLTSEQQDDYPPLCPDFVVELRSPTDNISDLQAKMQEYMNNGARLGWLIDLQSRQVEIYRSGQTVEILNFPNTVLGEDVLPGFVLDIKRNFELGM